MASVTSLIILAGILSLTEGNPEQEMSLLSLTVENALSNAVPETYMTRVVKGGVLLGALRQLQETQQDFEFTTRDDPDFGLFLESVNGLAGDENSYWEILAERSGDLTRLDVGIGCYKLDAFEHIILRFNQSF